MDIKGKLLITVAGRPVTRAAGDRVVQLIDKRIKLIDHDAQNDVRKFGDIAIISKWEAVPHKLGQAQELLTFMKWQMFHYFQAWRIHIKLELEEKEG